MSLNIKKKSTFKPKAAPRRPGGASTQTSARPSVERQSQTPIPSIQAEILSVAGRSQDEEGSRETSATEYTPQPSSSDPISQHNPQTTKAPVQDTPAPLPPRSSEGYPPDESPSEIDAFSQRRILPAETPIQTLRDVTRVDGSEAPATQQQTLLNREVSPNAHSVGDSLQLQSNSTNRY